MATEKADTTVKEKGGASQSKETGPVAEKPVEGFMRQHWNMIKLAAVIVLINVVMTLSVVVLYDHYFATKIEFVDIDSFRQHQKDLFYAGKISQDDLMNNLENYKSAILGMGQNTVLLYAKGGICRNGKFVEP